MHILFLSDVLEALGIEPSLIFTANNGTEAAKIIHRHGPISILIAGIHTGDKNGIELLDLAREENPECAGIIMSRDFSQYNMPERENVYRLELPFGLKLESLIPLFRKLTDPD